MPSFLDSLLSSPQSLNSLATGTMVGGQILGAVSHIQYGQAAAGASEFEAAQLRQLAGNAQATSQRVAFDVDRQTRYIASAALAAAASGGGGVSDPTVVNIMARTAQQGAYKQAVALYQGEDKARLLDLQADTKEYEGHIAQTRSDVAAAGQVLGAGASLLKGFAKDSSIYSRFGGGGPGISTGDY